MAKCWVAYARVDDPMNYEKHEVDSVNKENIKQEGWGGPSRTVFGGLMGGYNKKPLYTYTKISEHK